ncbi:site-specific integrase [Tsukamurella soli]|uniref:Site-specific integrase n=1 Tax=Tsukamurella soli TaxID=644556 RepID=A0ABP8KGB3_9ACTN
MKPVETSAGRRYEVRVHAHRADGTRFQHKKRFRTVDEAVKWRSTVVSQVAHGTHVPPSELTVRQAVDDWLAGQRIRSKTYTSYITNLRPLVDLYGDRLVQSITKQDVEKMVTQLRDGGLPMGDWHAPEKLPKNAKKVRDAWSASSINPCLARTRNVFDDLMNQGVVVRNPAALVKSLPKSKTELQTLTAKQVAGLYAATASNPWHVGWRLALMGLRRGEVLALQWDAVDLTAKTLTIKASRAPIPGGVATGDTKTKGSVRTLPMPPDLVTALRRTKKRQAESKLQLGSKWKDSGLVVVDEFGNLPHPDSFGRRWRRELKDAGLPAVRLHDARHSCATLMHQDGVPLADIAAWLGHSDAGFTLATYGHSTRDSLAAAATRLGAITKAGGKATGTRAKG